MKKFYTSLVLICLLNFALHANDKKNELDITTEGYLITVNNFEEGDVIKLYDVETGQHILTKTYGYVDLSQLPNGTYSLENAKGQSISFVRRNLELYVPGVLGSAYVIKEDAKPLEKDLSDLEQLESKEIKKQAVKENNRLAYKVVDNIVTIMDFEEGNKIKLFEVKNTVHVLTKSTNFIDLSQLEAGKYFIEDDKGRIAFIDKESENSKEANQSITSI